MRRALEEDQYSAKGSILDTESEDEGDHTYNYRGMAVRLDKTALQQAVRKHNLLQRLSQVDTTSSGHHKHHHHHHHHHDEDEEESSEQEQQVAAGEIKAKKKKSRQTEVAKLTDNHQQQAHHHHQSTPTTTKDPLLSSITGAAGAESPDEAGDREGSIFGATTGGQSNAMWVQCDKCKKWRRLRGLVDEKKLPSKWYCSMNKNDPDRCVCFMCIVVIILVVCFADYWLTYCISTFQYCHSSSSRCSAPEEDYDSPPTAESAADARTRKHLRVWVRRLQCNEAYEARQPTLTRGKKRAVASSSKDPYEWVRCCNPSCGKWRAVLRMMDAKGNVIDRCKDGEFYCVQNIWDEKVASCAAPQENLPAVGCPPWVSMDED